MSLVPLMFRDWWEDMGVSRPSRLLDQHFGTGLSRDDLFSSLSLPTSSILRGSGYYRPWRNVMTRQDSGSTISCDKDKFQVLLDVQQFSPDEITVKTSEPNHITVEGKHEEKQDEHGFVSRHFIRRYMIPNGHDVKDVVSTLSSDGVLTITVPKKVPLASGERIVQIQHIGPAKTPETQVKIESIN